LEDWSFIFNNKGKDHVQERILTWLLQTAEIRIESLDCTGRQSKEKNFNGVACLIFDLHSKSLPIRFETSRAIIYSSA